MTSGKHFTPDKLRRLGKKILTGCTERQIAREEHVSNATAHTIKVRLAAGGVRTLMDLDAMDDMALVQLVYFKEAAVRSEADARAGAITITLKRGCASNPLILMPDYMTIANRILDSGIQKINEFQDYVDLCGEKGRKAVSRSSFYRGVDAAVAELAPGAKPSETYLAQNHNWGLELQDDYLGGTFKIMDPDGTVKKLIVCEFCWAASNYVCAQFIGAMSTRETAGALVSALKFYGRKPALLVCDNAWSMVEKHEYGKEAIINPGMQRLLSKLGIQINPATVYSPQSKSAVEYAGRLIRERCLRRMPEGAVMSQAEASRELQRLIDRYINSAGFRSAGRGTSRAELYRRYEAPAAMPLPEVLPEYAEFYPHVRATRAYLVSAGDWTLSVPYEYAGRLVCVEIGKDEALVWTNDGMKLIARHALAKADAGRTIVDEAHMPPSHRAIKAKELKYKCEGDITAAARKLGPGAASLCSAILRRDGFLQGRKGCIAIINFGIKQIKLDRKAEFEEACSNVRAKEPRDWNSYKVVGALKTILQEEIDSEDGRFQKQSSLPLPDGGAPDAGDSPAKIYTCMIGDKDKEKNGAGSGDNGSSNNGSSSSNSNNNNSKKEERK